jgi:hypothetical protein
MSLDRTVKWIDKTCKSALTQKAEINSAKRFNTPVDS